MTTAVPAVPAIPRVSERSTAFVCGECGFPTAKVAELVDVRNITVGRTVVCPHCQPAPAAREVRRDAA